MLFEKLRAIICEFFELQEDEITPGTSFADIGADSLDMVDLAMSLEDDFNVEVTDETLETFVSVADVVKFLETELVSGSHGFPLFQSEVISCKICQYLKKIEQIRKERGIRQDEFARFMGVSRQTISSLETGRYNPSIFLAYKIAKYFDMTIEQVFIFDEEET